MTNTETTYRVTGMTCGGCSRSMKSALERVLPGLEATVSHADDTITVRGPHERTVVEQAVASAGFDFQGAVVRA